MVIKPRKSPHEVTTCRHISLPADIKIICEEIAKENRTNIEKSNVIPTPQFGFR